MRSASGPRFHLPKCPHSVGFILETSLQSHPDHKVNEGKVVLLLYKLKVKAPSTHLERPLLKVSAQSESSRDKNRKQGRRTPTYSSWNMLVGV